MTESAHHQIAIRAEEDVGALRRAVAQLAEDVPTLRRGDADLAATELGTNLVRHAAGGGYVLYRIDGAAIELISVDRGPGLAATGAASAGAHRQTSGLRVGLASVERLSSVFDCYSTKGGTVVLARLGARRFEEESPWRTAAVNVPLGGDGDSGDGCALVQDVGVAALLVDGLGHGAAAAAASRAALSEFDERATTNPIDFVRRAHQAMRSTRGAVLGLCVVDPGREEVSYVGVGNVVGKIMLDGNRYRLLGREGVLGTELAPQHLDVGSGRWSPGATLVLTSDGIDAKWDPSAYPGLLDHDPALLAAVLHRDHGMAADDSSVLVVRDARGGTR
jgi:anti-sigma regulatory factor (Ser/Thr protein kinase)